MSKENNLIETEEECFDSLVGEYKLLIPSDYNHDKQIDHFNKKVRNLDSTYSYSNDLTSENFVEASTRLKPGKIYKVKIFPILRRVTSEDCLSFLEKQKAILVGGQGMALAQSFLPKIFPLGMRVLSFDEKDSLWVDAKGNYRVPLFFHLTNGDWEFRVGYFDGSWCENACLLCFTDL